MEAKLTALLLHDPNKELHGGQFSQPSSLLFFNYIAYKKSNGKLSNNLFFSKEKVSFQSNKSGYCPKLAFICSICSQKPCFKNVVIVFLSLLLFFSKSKESKVTGRFQTNVEINSRFCDEYCIIKQTKTFFTKY